MAEKESLGEIYVKISADVASLGKDVRAIKQKLNKEIPKAKVDFDTILAKKKISELVTLQTKLRAKLKEKIKFDADLSSINRTRDALRSVDNQLTGLQKSSKGVLSNMGNWIAGIGIITIIGRVVRNAYQSFKDLDTGMRNVNTIIGVGQKELKKYSEGVVAIQKKLGISTKDLTNGFYQLVSAGVKAEDALQVLEISTKAGVGGLASTETAVDGITTALNAYQMGSAKANEVADAMFTTVKLGKTTFEQLASSLAQVLPTAASMGVSFDDVSAAIATLTVQGTPTAQAVTQIRQALIAMNQELGDGWGKTMTFNQGAEEMIKRAGGSQNKLKEMAGSVEAVSAILQVTGKNAQVAGNNFEQMGKKAGAAADAYKEQSKGLQQTTDRLNSSITSMVQNFIGAFGPALTWLFNNISGGLSKISGEFEATAEKMKNSTLDAGILSREWQKLFKGYSSVELKTALNEIDELISKFSSRKTLFGWDWSWTGLSESNEKIANELRTLKAQKQAIEATLKGIDLNTANTTDKPTGSPDETNTGEADLTKKIALLEKEKKIYDEVYYNTKKAYDKTIELIKAQTKELIAGGIKKEDALASEKKKIDELNTAYDKLRLSLKIIDELEEKRRKKKFKAPGKVDEPKKPAMQESKLKPYYDMIKDGGPFAGENGFVNAVETSMAMASGFADGFFEGLYIKSSQTNNLLVNGIVGMANAFIAQVQRMVGEWLAFQAIKATFGFLGLPVPGASTGGSFIGTSKGVKKYGSGGSFIVPPGYSNDNYPMFVKTGEHVNVTPANRVGEQEKLLSALVKRMDVLSYTVTDMSLRTANRNQDLSVGVYGKIENDAIYIAGKNGEKFRRSFS